MSLGSQVFKYRKQVANLSFAELAAMADVEVGTLNALEKRDSNRVDIRTVAAIAKALGMTIEELTDESADHSSKVKAHLLRQKTPPADMGTMVVSENIAPWNVSYWPFVSISQERFRSALDRDDLTRIEAYVQAIIETREAERQKNTG